MEPFPGSEAEALDVLLRRLRSSVSGQMVADVPVGALLSGGVDSSLIAALMAEHAPGKVRTFTIGYAEAAYDESAQAAAVAKHLGTDHTQLIASPADALALVPRMAAISGRTLCRCLAAAHAPGGGVDPPRGHGVPFRRWRR